MFHGEVEMGDFSLISEFENSKLEMGLIAAVAKNPTSLPEVSALLAEGAITVNAKAWNKVVTMIKAKKKIKVPETWKAASDPYAAAAALNVSGGAEPRIVGD